MHSGVTASTGKSGCTNMSSCDVAVRTFDGLGVLRPALLAGMGDSMLCFFGTSCTSHGTLSSLQALLALDLV